MPYSFTKIEEEKSKVIGFVLACLIVAVIKNYFAYEAGGYSYSSSKVYEITGLDFSQTLTVLGFAFFAGILHWSATVHNLIPKICKALFAQPLNPKDTYHQVFKNVIDEVSVATGGRKIEGVVIATNAMNAFALSDFRGRAVIGVTEGLLSRLSRAQLEAVIGHEAAHIISGDCLPTTVTSSLFQLYSAILIGSRNLVVHSSSSRSRSRTPGIVVVIYLVLLIGNFMGRLANM